MFGVCLNHMRANIYVLLNLIFAEICLTVMVLQRFGDASFRIRYPIQNLAHTQHLLKAKTALFLHTHSFLSRLSLTYNYVFSIFCRAQNGNNDFNTLQQKKLLCFDDSKEVFLSAILLLYSYSYPLF